MKFSVISTYPADGSQNAGDHLILTSLVELLDEHFDDPEICTVWRADNWENVSEVVRDSDHVFFACLAIRENMLDEVYPYLDKILDSSIPISVISAGTDLPVHKDINIYSTFPDEDIKILKRTASRAAVFSTRGALTQYFCKQVGLKGAKLDGDVAFYDSRFDRRKFHQDLEVDNIAISDPHYPTYYLPQLDILIDGLENIFSQADIRVVLHGINSVVKDFCTKKGIKCVEAYKRKSEGLDVYDDFDLHVGFRVHGHVSALKRRKYSYLLEQDGRGADYAANLDPKLSVANYCTIGRPVPNVKNLARYLLKRPLVKESDISAAPVHQLLAMIDKDVKQGFRKFVGLEQQIDQFNSSADSTIKGLAEEIR